MKNILLLLLLFFTWTNQLIAQQKLLTIEDYANPALRVKPLAQLAWRGSSDTYTYVNTEKNILLEGSAEQKEENILLTLEQLNEKFGVIAGNENLKNFPAFTWLSDGTAFTFIEKNALYSFNIAQKNVTKLIDWNKNAENLDFSSSNNVAFTEKGNLFISDAKSQVITQITKEDGYQVVCGESVHRQEFGINKGTFWSPDGSKIAFYRMDQSMVTDYPLSDYKEQPAVNNPIKYPMAGSKSHHVTVGIYDLSSKKIIYLKTGEPKEQYLTNLTWSSDGEDIFIAVLNRDQNKMLLNKYNVVTGNFVNTLFQEMNDKYVEPLHGLTFLPKSKDKFIWQSQRTGFNHLYEYNEKGILLRPLTSGNWEVEELLGFDATDRFLYFRATKESALESRAYRLDLKTLDLQLLTTDVGFHNVQVSSSGRYMLDNFSNSTTPLVTQLKFITNNNKSKKLLQTDNPLKAYNMGAVSIFSIASKDKKVDLFCRMIKPIDFDSTKKYPVMVYVYGGPHVQLVQNKWLGNADLFLHYMATKGYVIFTLDNRGSDRRGQNFENQTFRNLGVIEMEDQMAGIEFLKQQSFVDSTRLGCFGWSFGGFMTTSMMLKNPAVFKAAVAGGPVIDWKFYEVMYTERYMDTPENNPEGFKNTSLLNYVTNLKGKLLIIQGLLDDTVLPQHSATFVNECVAKGVLVDYFPYPNHAHNVRGKDRIHLYKKIEDYFKRNL